MSQSPSAIDPAAVTPQPHAAVETVFLAPEAVLFDDRHGEIHHLNASASAVWLLLDGEQSIVDVAAELGEIFGVPEPVLLADVETIVSDFRHRGLLACTDRAGSVARADHEEPRRIETLAPPPDP